jgi:hypothetical protein
MSSGINGPEAAILEQLRLQEGRLFQGEKTLALYLDTKAVALDLLSQAALEESDLESHARALRALAPKGTHEYHEKALHDVVKTVAKLLWPTQMLLVARPKLTTLLEGMHKRLRAAESVKNGTFAALDPFKQDFVVREAFRRTLVNDCLVVFDAEEDASSPAGAAEDNWAEDLDGAVGPDDSASQAPMAAPKQRPSGARSALGPIGEREEAEHSVADGASESRSAAAPAAQKADDDAVSDGPSATGDAFDTEMPPKPPARPERSVVSRAHESASVVRSVAPRVITVTGGASVVGSSVSHATGLSGSSVMHKLNVRKVRIVPDEAAL